MALEKIIGYLGSVHHPAFKDKGQIVYTRTTTKPRSEMTGNIHNTAVASLIENINKKKEIDEKSIKKETHTCKTKIYKGLTDEVLRKSVIEVKTAYCKNGYKYSVIKNRISNEVKFVRYKYKRVEGVDLNFFLSKDNSGDLYSPKNFGNNSDNNVGKFDLQLDEVKVMGRYDLQTFEAYEKINNNKYKINQYELNKNTNLNFEEKCNMNSYESGIFGQILNKAELKTNTYHKNYPIKITAPKVQFNYKPKTKVYKTRGQPVKRNIEIAA